ncbi:MAG: ATP-binding cassette domain-containing protein [Proteobacteria bacterium]|nr:ATP-binding cassette domain-containing protein [Pseudomonadota bacterium]
MIELKQVAVTFNRGDILEAHALRGITLNIAQGELVTVIGSNGAGKSTLLGTIAGDVEVNRGGSIRIENTEVTHLPAHRRATSVARVFQDPLAGTCANLTIEENMVLAATRGRGRGLNAAVTRRRRDDFRERLSALQLNLENRLQDPVGKLSGGQRQALSLIMATLAGSHILLLDEHTAALDPRMAKYVLELTQRIYQEYQLTVLMITHSMQSALEMGNRLIMLHQGKIIYDVSGEQRQQLTIPDLLNLFSRAAPDVSDTLLFG